MQLLEVCLPTDLQTTEAYFSFHLSFKMIVFMYYLHKMKYNCCQVYIFCFSKLNCLFGFSSRKVSQKGGYYHLPSVPCAYFGVIVCFVMHRMIS